MYQRQGLLQPSEEGKAGMLGDGERENLHESAQEGVFPADGAERAGAVSGVTGFCPCREWHVCRNGGIMVGAIDRGTSVPLSGLPGGFSRAGAAGSSGATRAAPSLTDQGTRSMLHTNRLAAFRLSRLLPLLFALVRPERGVE